MARTLFFISSILAGFKAPVASPKSVNLTWPVPSTKKFYFRQLPLPIPCSLKHSVVTERNEKRKAHLWLEITVDVTQFV